MPDWPCFLDDFQRHWPTDDDHVYVEFVRDGIAGNGEARMGNVRWWRLRPSRAPGIPKLHAASARITQPRLQVAIISGGWQDHDVGLNGGAN